MKQKKSFNILIKILNYCLFLFLAFIMIFCDSINQKTNTKESSQKITKPAREEPRLVYDDAGNITERHAKSYRKSDGSLQAVDSYYYKYDKRNYLVEETHESYTLDGLLKYKNVNVFTYDNKDQKVEMQFYAYDKNDSLQRQARTTYVYNSSGHPVKEQSYFEDGTVKGEIIREHNKNGDLLSEEFIHYQQDGSKKDHKKYYYTQYGLEKTEDLMEEIKR